MTQSMMQQKLKYLIRYTSMAFSNEERVLGVIPNVKSGVFGQKGYNIVVTDTRIVIAQLTSGMIREEAKRIARESKEKGEGRLKRMAATMMAGMNLHRRYLSMPVAGIIVETNGNFTIESNQIESIKIKADFSDDKTGHELRKKWTGGKTTFHFSDIGPKDAKSLLKQTFGNLVK